MAYEINLLHVAGVVVEDALSQEVVVSGELRVELKAYDGERLTLDQAVGGIRLEGVGRVL